MNGYVTSAQRHDVVSVGDVSMDVFIHVPAAGAEVRVDEGGRRLVLPYGAKVLCGQGTTVAPGGDAANAAVAFARLGLRVAIAAFFAHDQYGRDLLTSFRSEGVDTQLVHVDAPSDTNRNFVLWYGSDATILVRHQLFNYHWPALRPSDVPAWIYLTSIGPNGLEYEDQIAEWLEANPTVRLAFRPGTAQLEAGAERLGRLLRRCEILIVNELGGAELTGHHPAERHRLLTDLLALGPARVAITDRAGGAAAADAGARYLVPAYPDTTPAYEQTGADDAFAATVVAGLVAAVPFERALLRGSVNAMSVKHEIGAQAGLLREEELAKYLEEAPASFAVDVS